MKPKHRRLLLVEALGFPMSPPPSLVLVGLGQKKMFLWWDMTDSWALLVIGWMGGNLASLLFVCWRGRSFTLSMFIYDNGKDQQKSIVNTRSHGDWNTTTLCSNHLNHFLTPPWDSISFYINVKSTVKAVINTSFGFEAGPPPPRFLSPNFTLTCFSTTCSCWLWEPATQGQERNQRAQLAMNIQ